MDDSVNLHTILGPPGCGKTTILATRWIPAAVERFGPDRVIVASLTKTAATEIASRGIPVNTENVGTLHAICYRAMGKPKIVDKVPGLIAEFNRMYDRNLTSQSTDVDDLGTEQSDGIGDEIRQHYDLLRARMLPRSLWPAHVLEFAQEWEAFKSFTGAIDFTDMIERAINQFDSPPGNPAAIFYDEAQDGSALELALISQWARHVDHTVIAGDDEQALYTWRGASVESFLGFSEDKRVLSRSYRLPRTVHAYAQAWAGQLATRFPKEYEPRPADGSLRFASHMLRAPEEWLSEVEAVVDSGRSVMLLTTCGYMLNPVLAVLKQRGTPFHNPYRLNRKNLNPLAPSGEAGPPVRLAAFGKLACSSPSPWTWHELHLWTEHLSAECMPRGSKVRIADVAKDKESGQRNQIVPLANAASLLGDETLARATAGDVDWYVSHILEKKASAYDYLRNVVRSRGYDGLRSHLANVQGKPKRGLTVGTVHSVKGGEADVVYLWPELSPAGYEEYTGTDDQRDNVLRTIYVGITRAREAVVLCDTATSLAVDWLPAPEEVTSAA